MAWSKESRHARGYGTAWDKLRTRILKRDSFLCQCDRCKGGEMRTTLATEVNHIVSKAEAERLGWTAVQVDHPSNLQAINHDCHVRVTQEQLGHQPRHPTAADGWPMDPDHHWNRPR